MPAGDGEDVGTADRKFVEEEGHALQSHRPKADQRGCGERGTFADWVPRRVCVNGYLTLGDNVAFDWPPRKVEACVGNVGEIRDAGLT